MARDAEGKRRLLALDAVAVLKAHLAAVPDDDYAQRNGAIALRELE
jgi:hypothetical protein